MSYPGGGIDVFSTKRDGVDSVLAAHMNAVQASIVAIETELGTGLHGTLTDLTTRLNVGLNADGTLKSSAFSGVILPDNQGLVVFNNTGGTITAGQLLHVSGYNVANSLAQVSLAANNVATASAVYIATTSIANATSGTVKRHWTSTANLNTNGSSVGAAVYLDSTPGGWTLTTPASPNRQRIVGRVIVVSASVGQIEFDLISNGMPVAGHADLPADVAYTDSANTFTTFQTITAPSGGRCLTLNADTGAAVFVQPKSGTLFSNYKVNGAFQWGTDPSQNGTNEFFIQNLVTGDIVVECDPNNILTLGCTHTGAYVAFIGHQANNGTAAPGAAAGSNAGTTPPSPVVTAGDNDTRGNITFGTGTGPAAGSMVAVTFAAAYVTAPVVMVVPKNTATQALGLYVTAVGTGGFTLACTTAPAASQANTVYSFDYWVIG